MRKGAAGVAQLNARLQALLNPPAPGRTELSLGSGNGVVLRVGDRVIQVMLDHIFRFFLGVKELASNTSYIFVGTDAAHSPCSFPVT